MLIWAEDKVRREIDGLKQLTVRMILRAEQRTVAAVLHSRSATQTREVMVAAYRRTGLMMDQPPRENVQGREGMQNTLIAQNHMIMQYLRKVHGRGWRSTEKDKECACYQTSL